MLWDLGLWRYSNADMFQALCSSSSKMVESKLNILLFFCIILHYEITNNIKFHSRFKLNFEGVGS